MYKNYNSLSTGRDTCLKNRIGDRGGSPPTSNVTWSRWLMGLILLFSMLAGNELSAQVNVYNFATGTGATIDPMTGATTLALGADVDDGRSPVTAIGFPFTYAGVSVTQFSANANGLMRLGATRVTTQWDNTAANANTATPVVMPYWDDLATGTTGTVRYVVTGSAPNRILVVEWFVTVPRNTSGAANARFQVWLHETTNVIDFVYGSGMVANSANAGATIGLATSTTVYNTVDAATNTNTTSTFITSNTGAITSGRFYTWTPPVPCAGTPAPGDTTGPASVCSGRNFTLGLQNATLGSGVTYLWQRADDLGFTTNVATVGGNTPTVTTSETVARYYRASVTCSGNTTISTPLFVALNAPAQCPCIPVTTSGCTDGDVIARVTLNTLDNNSGTGCPSGLAGYSDYTGNGLLTTTLQAGSNYSCTVFAGQYPEGYAAWIDYNDDGVFDNTTERIGGSVGQVAGSGLVGVLGSSASFPINVSCNPPLGAHRLRVRAMYNTDGSAVTPCTANTFGETEDYLVTISTAVPCPQPFNLGANTVTATTANLTWTLGCAETAWEIAVQPVNSGVPVSGVATASTTYPATYTAGTANEFYVRADCGGGSLSEWSGPFVFTAPACTTPVDPSDGAVGVVVTAGGLQLTWSPSPGATTYSVAFGTTPGALPVLGSTAATTVGITGVTPNTVYYWRIDPVNAFGTAAGCSEWSFTTEVEYCIPAPTSVDGTGITNVSFGTINNTTGAETGNFGDYTAQVTDVVSTLNVPVNITFDTGFTYDTKIWVDWNDDMDFNDVGEEVYSGTSLATQPTTLAASFLVSGPLGQHRLRIGGVDAGPPTPCWTGSFGTFEDYTINVLPPPPCVAPTALTATNVTETTADVSWTASVSNPADGYEYEVRSSGAGGSGATGLAASGATVAGDVDDSVSGLTTETVYTLYVRSVCTTGSDYSNWASSSTFRTGYCQATYTNGPGTTDQIANVTLGTLNNSSGASSSPYYTFYNALTVPNLTEGTSNNVSVTFGSDGSQFAGVWVDFNNNLVFEASEGFVSAVNAGSSGTTVIPVTVPFGVTPGNVRMRVRGGNDSALTTAQACGASSSGFGETEDYIVNLIASVPCTGTPDPGATVSTDETVCSGVQFTLSVENATPGAGVTYQWESADDSGFTTNVTALGTAETQVVTMTATKFYRLAVTCSGNTGYSIPLEVVLNAANQCYCVPTTTFGCTDGDVIARVTLNTLDNNSGTGCPSGTLGYSDYTATPGLTTTLQAGSTYNCTVFAGEYPEGYAAWVDYNDDGVFDNVTEKIGFSAGQVAGSGIPGQLGSSATFPIHLACNPPIGDHRLRVRAMYNINGSAVTPCTANSFGETEDYIITISAPAACPQPSALAATNVTATSADLSWVIGCAESAWEVLVQPTGTGVPSDDPLTGTPVATNAFAATYASGTSQEFYVRAECGGLDGYSVWSGPFVITAPPCPVLTAPADDSIDADPGATQLVWTASPSATSYTVYLGTTSGALNNLGSIAGTTVGINGLQYNTEYFWRIDAVSPQGTSPGCTEFSFTTSANVPAFDTCEGAISLDALPSPQSGSTSGLSSDFEPSCDTGGASSPDAYYSITVPAYNTLNIGQTVNSYDSIISLLYGDCNGLTEITCTDEPDTGVGSQLTWFNNTGSTQTVYYVQDGYAGASGTFTIAWTLSAPAACSLSTTWNGSAWSNGYPIATQQAVIEGDYSSVGNLSACSLTVNSGNVTVNSGDDFTITGAVTVSGGSLTFANNANLIQVNDVNNSGAITVQRDAVMRRLDYVYWGSPVAGQDLKLFSPYTVSPTNPGNAPTPTTGPSRFYTLNEATNSFAVIAEPLGVNFTEAKGYMLRAPNNFPTNGSQATFNGVFTGVPNNGDASIAITNTPAPGQGFNMLGNPYPSTVSADLFLAQNPGALYFWTHSNQNAASGANYATYTNLGTAAAAGGPAPDGSIAIGQGFLLKTAASGTATFTNAMRTGNNSAHFFRDANIEKNRIWLNLSNAVGVQNQILVGYMEGATMDADVSIDAKQIEGGISNIASLIGEQKYNIQGRALPFVNTDEIPLSFNALAAGEFTISIDHLDGLFAGDQNVYIKDNIFGITHNVKESGYTFAAEAGTTANRFSVVFQNTTLGVENPTFDADNVIIFKADNVLNINSGSVTMSGVKVFDIRGRLIFEQSGINANTAVLKNLRAEQEVLLVQITSDDNRVVTKKVVY